MRLTAHLLDVGTLSEAKGLECAGWVGGLEMGASGGLSSHKSYKFIKSDISSGMFVG